MKKLSLKKKNLKIHKFVEYNLVPKIISKSDILLILILKMHQLMLKV